jgi:glucose/arabinose dehydrogenase
LVNRRDVAALVRRPPLVLALLLLALSVARTDSQPVSSAAGDVVLTSIGHFSQPVFVTHAGDSTHRLFVVERAGTIRVIAGGTSMQFLDIRTLVRSSGSEQGLLGLAFDPRYPSNGLFYVYYTAPDRSLTLARYRVSANPNQANSASGQVLLSIPHPTNDNHNGGMLAFGPDGYLYVGTGDGGGAGDVPNNAQNLDVLLGKLLRLDVGGGAAAAASSNPLVGQPGDDRIWAYGLRNPWRFSFDRATNDLYIGDVGQGAWEEIDFQPAGTGGGRNYGWHIMEGNHCYNAATCSSAGLTPPVIEYDHGQGCSVTGGYVYRGTRIPTLQGAYVYGDYCSGTIWSVRAGTWSSSVLMATSHNISSFGEDEDGELYLTDLGGDVYRFDSTSAPTPSATSSPSSTPSPTTTRTITPSATRSPTPPLSATPSPSAPPPSSPTPNPSGTPTPRTAPAVGGRGASITAGASVGLRWRDGAVEDGYVVARVATGSGSLVVLPPDGRLAADATAYVDSGPFPEDAYCYVVLPMLGSTALGLSDLMCAWPHVAQGSQAPAQFTLRLDETTTATLTWLGPGSQDAYILLVLPTDGSPQETIGLSGGAAMTTHSTRGVPTCYVLVALAGTQVLGNTAALCGVPNVQTLAAHR